MLFVKITILLILFFIFIQDILYRSVHWALFPLLGGLLVYLRQSDQPVTDILQSGVVNAGFLTLQLFLVTAYFSLKNKRLTNITNQLMGWGDVLFLSCTAWYLSCLNFIFFYSISLVIVLFFWLNWQLIVKTENPTVPLAGFQAILLVMALISDWWYIHFDLTSDDWLLKFLAK